MEGYSFEGMKATTQDEVRLKIHPFLTTYVDDILEAKHIAAVLNGNQSAENCHNCLAPTSLFSTYKWQHKVIFKKLG